MVLEETWQSGRGIGLLAFGKILCLLLLASGCATSRSAPLGRAELPAGSQTGIASFYADKYEGKRTASGEIYRKSGMTAAHRSYPFGTRVRITNLENDRSVVVRVNDRGPFISGRVIDVSLAAARELDMVHIGLVRVQIDLLAEAE